MRRPLHILAVSAFVFTLLGSEGWRLVPAASSAEPVRPVQATIRDRGAGGVTVTATWQGFRDGAVAFRLSLDTHSVDLSGFDVLAHVGLRAGAGAELRPLRWEEERSSSHHRTGVLYFPVPNPLPDRLALVVRDLAGVAERVLAFEFGN
ncbi:MAG: hypothetical protein QN193_05510 [Armatimonadota bacterium]|nr:hypothetical protein [Armatimonadota bacterium]MDR7443949.1 hypothetical protein [Armatimonadota bacterium]MDR7570047.1 hypothetical protein [Armatimonadota bacterium]MDR7615448.1 hypothetical protein [Armatimonadota bacterium]